MFKFGGFKASLNFYNGTRRKSQRDSGEVSAVSLSGAYRTNRDEFFSYNYPETQKVTPSVVPVTTTDQPPTQLRQVKSTSDLIKNKNIPPNLLQNNQGVSQDPRGAEQNESRKNNQVNDRPKVKKLDAEKRVEKQRLEEQKKVEKQRLEEQKKVEKQRLEGQKKLEKQQLEEQKKREKLALQEQAKQEKLRKEREKNEAKQAKKEKNKKKVAPQRPVANPLAQAGTSASNNPQGQTQFMTNTLESSISKTSGPPPYAEVPKPEGDKDTTGNVTYSKPIDTGSWDIISKHRENINRPMNTASTKQGKQKQMVMDLNFKVEENTDNSEA